MTAGTAYENKAYDGDNPIKVRTYIIILKYELILIIPTLVHSPSSATSKHRRHNFRARESKANTIRKMANLKERGDPLVRLHDPVHCFPSKKIC